MDQEIVDLIAQAGVPGVTIVGVVALWRFLTTTVWTYYTQQAAERWQTIAKAISDITQLRSDIELSGQIDRDKLDQIDSKLDRILDQLTH